jgi:hypothetical protein
MIALLKAEIERCQKHYSRLLGTIIIIHTHRPPGIGSRIHPAPAKHQLDRLLHLARLDAIDMRCKEHGGDEDKQSHENDSRNRKAGMGRAGRIDGRVKGI